MNALRTHCSAIAWMLYAVVLFNGLACSVGHGQMMQAFVGHAGPAAEHTAPGLHAGHGGHGGHPEMHMPMAGQAKTIDLSGSMNGQSGDCAFAGTLTLAMIFFVALGWLIRTRQPRPVLPTPWCGDPARHVFPGLNPQAP